jgi:hypothetical protein
MHDIEFDGKAKKVAATWDELSRRQLELLLPILYGNYSDANQLRIEVLEVLLGVSRPLLLRLTDVHLVQVFWLTDFLLAEPITLTRQLLPEVKPARLLPTYYGPAAELANVSFLEFAFADAYFVAYANSQQVEWLDQLVATLYRPGRRMVEALAAGDRRQPFNEHVIEAQAGRLARLPRLTRLAILTWYRGCAGAALPARVHARQPGVGQGPPRWLGLRAARDEWPGLRQLRRNRPPTGAPGAGQDERRFGPR